VPTPPYQFLLSEAIGSSRAAIAAYLDEVGLDPVFPEFSYWPSVNIGKEQACTYSFGDGGILENPGIVPLLRRKYKVIFCICEQPVPGRLDCGRLLQGRGRPDHSALRIHPAQGNSQNTQIFPSSQYNTVLTGLTNSKAAGGVVVGAGFFSIQTPNNFGLEAYPGNGEVLIFWLYNDLNKSWAQQLQPSVQTLLTSTNPSNYMANFSNYDTVGQKEGELLLLTAQQVNLLADMWSYSVISGFTGRDQAFGISLKRP
jgi:hypothetical protein